MPIRIIWPAFTWPESRREQIGWPSAIPWAYWCLKMATEVFSRLSQLGAPIVEYTATTTSAWLPPIPLPRFAAGASQAHVTVNGIGERAGNASLEEVVMTLEALYKFDTGIRCQDIYQLSRMVSRMTGIPRPPTRLSWARMLLHTKQVSMCMDFWPTPRPTSRYSRRRWAERGA